MLPNVKIDFANGALGVAQPMDDGCAALLAAVDPVYLAGLSGSAVPVEVGDPFAITKPADLDARGIAEIDPANPSAGDEVRAVVRDFYREAPEGQELWLCLVPAWAAAGDTTIADRLWSDDTGRDLLRAARGKVRLLIVEADDDTMHSADVANNDAPAAWTAANQLCQWATDELYAPCIAVMPSKNIIDTFPMDHIDCTVLGLERVAVVDGQCDTAAERIATGLAAGRLAAIPVHRSLARVKTGPINASPMLLAGAAADQVSLERAELRGVNEVLHEMGYIVPRTFVGLAGYYWSSDQMACDPTSDYALIPRRRTIDKAYRIAYRTLVREIGDELPVNADGTPVASVAKAIETKVESALLSSMGESIGADPADPKDLGVRCTVDLTQNLVATNTLAVAIRIRPYGYAYYIEATLGFEVEQ